MLCWSSTKKSVKECISIIQCRSVINILIGALYFWHSAVKLPRFKACNFNIFVKWHYFVLVMNVSEGYVLFVVEKCSINMDIWKLHKINMCCVLKQAQLDPTVWETFIIVSVDKKLTRNPCYTQKTVASVCELHFVSMTIQWEK